MCETRVEGRNPKLRAELRAGCWEAAAATAILPYLERRKNDPREHREAAGFGVPNQS